MTQPRSFIFTVVAKGLFFVLNVVALHLLLRGHNLPGGGFIAGLVVAISLVLLTLALGWEELHRIVRVDPAWLAIVGLALAGGSAVVPWLLGGSFLEQSSIHLQVPVWGEIHLGTALVFDSGVLLVVTGMACKVLFVVGKSTEGLRALVEVEEGRYAAPVEEPIEAEAVSVEEGGESNPGTRAADHADG